MRLPMGGERRLAVLGAALAAGCATTPQPVDLLLVDGKVLTVDEDFSIASAVAVDNGRIIAIGGDEVAGLYSATTTIDLDGRVLMPGFTDTHIHIRGLSPREVDLDGVTSIEELKEIVAAKAAELGPGEWVTGRGWDEALFAEGRNPNRYDLDEAAPDNPVVLSRAGGHSSVGNSLALEIAGITADTPQPEAGLIEHDENGEPNGVIRERSDLYRDHVPRDSWEDLRGPYTDALRALPPLGITSVMEASGSIDDEPVGLGGVENPRPGFTYRRLREIYDAEGGDELPRIALYISYPGAERFDAFPHHTGYGDDRVRLGPVGENGVDGGFTGPTAWTLADYKGQPGFRGAGPRFTDAELQELVDTSAKNGWQLGLHAIGDAAIVQTVRAYSASLHSVPGLDEDHRWFLDHFTVMPPAETMDQMAADGIMIAQQPNFTYNLEGRYRETMDDWRVAHINAVRTPAHDHGLFVAFGSDNLPIGPMVGLYAAVTRKGLSGEPLGYEEEAVSIEEAIRMYTANGPYLTFEEDEKGTLEVGKLADMVVLDADPLTIPPDELIDVNVDLTIIGGNVVHDRREDAM